MTTDEVEAIVGPFLRPNLRNGREFFAWIGEGGMLRASFKGPGKTLSVAVLDVAEEQRPLDLGPDARRRVRQATIIQTCYCVPCRQRYQQPQSGRAVMCAACGGACERPVAGIRVPGGRAHRRSLSDPASGREGCRWPSDRARGRLASIDAPIPGGTQVCNASVRTGDEEGSPCTVTA